MIHTYTHKHTTGHLQKAKKEEETISQSDVIKKRQELQEAAAAKDAEMAQKIREESRAQQIADREKAREVSSSVSHTYMYIYYICIDIICICIIYYIVCVYIYHMCVCVCVCVRVRCVCEYGGWGRFLFSRKKTLQHKS